jgi:hypothetical protein
MSWAPLDGGATLGGQGSENGVIERDDEHAEGARITLERDGTIAPFAITCGVYGWMCHTRFFSTRDEADREFEAMKAGLSEILALIPLQTDPGADVKSKRVADAIQDFVTRFP